MVATGAIVVIALCGADTLRAESWPSIDPAELKATRSTVDPDADAEVLLWEIRLLDALTQSSLQSAVSQYLRIKIYTDQGTEYASRIDIPYEGSDPITSLAARTIRPDGSTVEVDRKAFFDRTIIKAGGRKVKATSFAFPSVQKGCIVEYRWTSRRGDASAHLQHLVLQRDLPIRQTELWVRPLSFQGLHFRARSFNMPAPYFDAGAGGYQRAVLPPKEALRTEPFMPPASAVSPWVLFYYAETSDPPAEKVWRDFGTKIAEETESKTRPDGSVRAKAVELTAGARDDDERLDRLYDYCRRQIRNLANDAAWDPSRVKASRSPAETLKRGFGAPADIDYLFAAMANAVGFTTRMALTADRRENLFDPRLGIPGFLSEWSIAVRKGTAWRFFDPAARSMPAGMLPWWQEGQEALVADRAGPMFVSLPMAAPDSSRESAEGTFVLGSDGTLEGMAVETFTGHADLAMRELFRGWSQEEREQHVRNAVVSRYPGAQVDTIRFEHADDIDGPLVSRYHVRIPGYASRAGSRLLTPPAYFQSGLAGPSVPGAQIATMTQPTRTHPIYFPYAWTRSDRVQITLPEGFEVESAPEPKPIGVEGFMRQQGTMRVAADGRSLLYEGSVTVCENGALYFPASQYAALQKVFEGLRERDRSSISLRQVSRESGR